MPSYKLLFALSFSLILLFSVYVYKSDFLYRYSNQHDINITYLTGEYDPNDEIGVFEGKEVRSFNSADSTELAYSEVLGQNSNEVVGTLDSLEEIVDGSDKRIEVDLEKQRLYAFEGDEKVFDFLVSTGKWGKTPTGEFDIWIKLRSTKMSGGSKELGTYYYLPNVPYTMFFSNDKISAHRGFGIHGTYWHDNFGHPMSHGCINMKTEEVEQLYYWAHPTLPEGKSSTRATDDNPGTKILIYGTAPNY